MKVQVTRPLMLGGERVEADTVLELDSLQAAAAVASGRAEYVDRADAERAAAAVAEQRDRQLGALERAEAQAAATWMLRLRQRA